MLYLLLDFIVDDELGNSEKILKIGYSEKRFCESRKREYDTHNYGYRLIQEIEGTKEDEKSLHKRFKHLLLPRSREWFRYSDDIVEEFYTGWHPGDDILESLISISPITMSDLERNYLNDIINQDLLLGYDVGSIYLRIDLTISAVKYIWNELLGGKSIEEMEAYIAEKIKDTEHLLSAYQTTKNETDKERPGCSITLAEHFKNTQEGSFYWNYISVLGEYPNYDVKFNTGRLKIDQLALEAYKKELERHNKCK